MSANPNITYFEGWSPEEWLAPFAGAEGRVSVTQIRDFMTGARIWGGRYHGYYDSVQAAADDLGAAFLAQTCEVIAAGGRTFYDRNYLGR